MIKVASADGTDVHALDEGRGPVILVIHPGNDDGTSWRKVAARLSGRFRVVRIVRRQYRLDLPAPYPYSMAREVEDVLYQHEAVREAALAMMDELGYRRLEASNAESALALVEAGAEVDLVFTDVVMPGPLRTREFAQRLKAVRPALPVLFTSGYTDNAMSHQGRLDEGVNLIAKPYAKADLARRIAQLLAEAGGGAWSGADGEALAVLLDLSLGERIQIGDDFRPGAGAAERGDAVLQCLLQQPGQGSCRTRGRGWSRRACGRSAGSRTGAWRCERSAPPSTAACSRAWLRAG